MSTRSTKRRGVIVTGGAAGIGWAAARRFAAAGDRVAILDRSGEAAAGRAGELGAGHLALAVDVADERALEQAIRDAATRLGRLDVLVNNAAIIDANGTATLDATMADFRALMAVNLDGVYVAAREAGRIMLAAGRGGAIVNIASLAGVIAVPNRNAYSTSKGAVIGLTRALACEWAAAGIRVNAVLPGYVGTEMVRALERGGKVDIGVVERRIPMGRLAEPEEIAALIHHLGSGDASFTAGAMIAVDGGFQSFGGTAEASGGGGRPAKRRSGPRVAVVTGAGSGIGAAIARRMAAQGDRLLLFDRNAAALRAMAEELGEGHLAVAGDVTDEKAALAAVAATITRYGRIDLLVNNAGIADVFRATVDQSLADFRTVIDSNLTGALTMARAVAPTMIAAGRGAIVNLSSIAGVLGLPKRNGYCAAKAGIVMLTRSPACEWARHGIRVNAVAPGYIATPGVMALEQAGRRDLGAIRRRTPMGRLGDPAEIAAVVDFLGSADASYMTGTLYAADGGWSAFGDAGDASEP